MDDTLTVESGATLGTAETATPEQSTGTGNAAPQTQSTEGGEEQSSTESGQQQTGQGRKRWSIQDEVKELRAQRRELREQVASFGQMQEEMRQLREEMMRRNQPGVAKTPANFWQDPEGVIGSRLEAIRDELRDSITSEFHTTREQEFQQAQLRQETASAAEFIRSQQGYDPSDEEDIVEIIKENGLAALGPSKAATTAWALFQQSRGVGDRSLQKRQAASVQGQPPGVGFGKKVWSRTEFDQAVNAVEAKPHDPKMTELFNELMAAHKEGRVR